ncbi:uncharacterized protein LOC144163174 [Haemaphysalis longicornis]
MSHDYELADLMLLADLCGHAREPSRCPASTASSAAADAARVPLLHGPYATAAAACAATGIPEGSGFHERSSSDDAARSYSRCRAYADAEAPNSAPLVPVGSQTPVSGGMSADAASIANALASAMQQALQAARSPEPRVQLPVPTYSGYGDQSSANAFLLALSRYEQATGISESAVLRRVLPAALVDQAAGWYRMIGHTARTMDDFRTMFREEFLPIDYLPRMRRELEMRTQAPDESLVEYVRAMQELYEYADPNAPSPERVDRVVRQCHPTFALYLRNCSCRDLNELAAEARRVQAAVAAARAYRPPPPPVETLEPSCAWRGVTGSGRAEPGSTLIPSQRETLDLGARALDPYSCGLRYAEAIRPDSLPAPRAEHRANRLDDRPANARPLGLPYTGSALPQLPAPAHNSLPENRMRPAGRGAPEQPQSSRHAARSPVRCYKCRQAGHIARFCPVEQGNGLSRR